MTPPFLIPSNPLQCQANENNLEVYFFTIKTRPTKREKSNFQLGHNRDTASLDIFWLRDESLEESDNLPDPDVLAQEIVEDIEAALEQFREVAEGSVDK